MAKGNANMKAVLKMQAFVRGCISRHKNGSVNRKKKGKKGGSEKGISDLEQKMLSARGGQFCGGMPSNRRSDSQRNGLVYAK